jgi:hypothetical protein
MPAAVRAPAATRVLVRFRRVWHNAAMRSATPKNLHVPLPPGLYRALRAVADEEGRAATQVAREAIAQFVLARRKRDIEDELRAYVATAAGSPDDLDGALVAATVEHLAPRQPKPRKRRAR